MKSKLSRILAILFIILILVCNFTGCSDQYDKGYKDGLEDGRYEWHEENYNEGYDEGYGIGLEEGLSAGYNQGYDDAKVDAEAELEECFDIVYEEAASDYEAYIDTIEAKGITSKELTFDEWKESLPIPELKGKNN